jgi:uncharacterized protein (TIGR01319 family)
MVANAKIGSILAIDIGTVMTKAMLLDRINGEYRFVASGEAPTTFGPSPTTVIDGVRHAVERISQITGLQFFDDTGRLISSHETSRRGVDAFTATVSASEPLQVVLSGLVEDLSIASAKRAASGTYSQVTSLVNEGQGMAPTDEERVRTICATTPDVVCLAGGIDGGAERPVLDAVKAATLACAMMDRNKRPTLLYAGNSHLRRQVTDIVEDEAELRVVNNVRPTLEDEQLLDAQQEFQRIFAQRKMQQLPGFVTLTDWSPVPVAPTAQAFGQLIQYLWHLGNPERGILGIDVGGANTAVAAVFNERLHMTVQGGLGVAFGGEDLLEQQGLEAITQWFPEAMPYHELQALLISKRMHPTSIPQVSRELWVEQALICAAIRTALEIARPGWRPGAAQAYPDLMPLFDTILISGSPLTRAARPGQAALAVLNALQPIGVSTLVLDTYGLAPALGNVAAVKPLAAVEALDAGVFSNLATVVTPVGGDARLGDTILRVSVSYDNGSELSIEVQHGDLEVLPLPLGQEAILELSPSRGFDVGFGGQGKAGKRRVSGGLTGLVIDARGRPLPLAGDTEQRHGQMEQWLSDVGG